MPENVTGISNLELLVKLIGDKQAKALYRDRLRPLFCSEPEQQYLGHAKDRALTKLAAARELVKRYIVEELAACDMLNSPSLVRDYLRVHFADRGHECFVALFLDAHNRLLAVEELFRGTLTQTSVYPREIVKRALYINAASLIFAHNHPSGIAEPSHADELLTRALKQSLALVDVRVIDHFIVASTGVMSFAERGLI